MVSARFGSLLSGGRSRDPPDGIDRFEAELVTTLLRYLTSHPRGLPITS